ncbi:HotDog domain-containing protein [Hypoxylon sp. FL0543]|nr:HotDog domain-containing protein [Hypoxylon sp. FL0543]
MMLVGRLRGAQVRLRPAVLARPMHICVDQRFVHASLAPAARLRYVAPTTTAVASQLRFFSPSRLTSAAEDRKIQDPAAAAAAATATTPTPPSQSTLDHTDSTSKSSPPPARPRRRRGLYYSTVFLLVGLSLGTVLRLTLAPPPLPAPGSAEDEYLASTIQARGAALPLVQQLTADPSWDSWDAYAGFHEQPNARRLVSSRITSGPLSGSRGLPFQRVFHNAATGEVVSVVYFGAGTAGWPGVVHGGTLATVLDESLGRCAILRFPARTGVTARLELAYRRPTLAGGYYVVRTRPMVAAGEDPAKSARKMWVEGTLETLEGKTCVEAKALFVVPKGVQLKPLVEGF